MKGGRINVGNQAPPIALIVRIKKVLSPLDCAGVLLNAATTMPNEVAAAEEAIIIKNKLKKLEKISIPKKREPTKNKVTS